ncbi:hypothetical protein BGZ47_002624, partial [Haplosporangium gracile]
MTPSHALPITLEPRRNPLTIGLGLRGGGLGLSLGGNGNSLFNFHHRPRDLHARTSIEPPSFETEIETQAAEKNEAIVPSLLQKRSALSGPPASGAEADSDNGSTGGGGRPLGSPSKEQYHILPIAPSEARSFSGGSDEEEGGVVRRSGAVENKKRQHVPGSPPGSG